MWKPCVCCQFCRVVHLHIVSFTEDFFVHASKTLGEFSGTRSQHSAFQKWRSENHVFFLIIGSLQKCKFSKMNETCSVAILFHIYIYIYTKYMRVHQSWGPTEILRFLWRFFQDMCWSFAGFFGGVCCIDFPKGFLWIEISWISKTPRCQLGCP